MPRGGWSLQGNFLSREIQDEVERLVKDVVVKNNEEGGWRDGNWEKEHVDAEDKEGEQDKDGGKERLVDVVLSDMSAPWLPTSGMWLKSISNPFYRMMNTSGIAVRDHFGSMVSFFFILLISSLSSFLRFIKENEKLIYNRIYALLLCHSVTAIYVQVVILYVNSIKDRWTKILNCG